MLEEILNLWPGLATQIVGRLKRFIPKVMRPKHQANVLKRLVSLKVIQIQMLQPPFYLPAKVLIF